MKLQSKEITKVAIAIAIMGVLAQISIPLPFSPVPITMQIFGVTLVSFILGSKLGTYATIGYALLGTMGIPVFSNFTGGFNKLVGPTGGFIIGFILMAYLIGKASEEDNKLRVYILVYVGLILDYFFGVIQLSIVAKMSLAKAFMVGAAPFIIKDIIVVALAIMVAIQVKNRISKLVQA